MNASIITPSHSSVSDTHPLHPVSGIWVPSTSSSDAAVFAQAALKNPEPPAYPAPVHLTAESTVVNGLAPPDSPPPYTLNNFQEESEPESFARHMFWLGFIFPLFWVAGICLIFSKLRAPPTWEEEKTAAQREDLLHQLRQAELRWAKRCLWAFLTLSLLATLLFLIVKFSILRP